MTHADKIVVGISKWKECRMTELWLRKLQYHRLSRGNEDVLSIHIFRWLMFFEAEKIE